MMQSLEKKGLVKADWSNRNDKESVFTLTENGVEEAKKVWTNTPDEIREIVEKSKTFFSLSTAQEIMHYFHKKYPEYKKTYTKPEPLN